MWVATVLRHKRNGTYLELGCCGPEHHNNTCLLERELGWTGISIDNNPETNWFYQRPDAGLLIADATNLDYHELLKDMPEQIDYLQVDIDTPQNGLECLKKVLSTPHRFSTITFETDVY